MQQLHHATKSSVVQVYSTDTEAEAPRTERGFFNQNEGGEEQQQDKKISYFK